MFASDGDGGISKVSLVDLTAPADGQQADDAVPHSVDQAVVTEAYPIHVGIKVLHDLLDVGRRNGSCWIKPTERVAALWVLWGTAMKSFKKLSLTTISKLNMLPPWQTMTLFVSVLCQLG